MRKLKLFLVLAAVLASVVGAYLAYDPYRTEEDEVFELNLLALSDGDEGEGGEGDGEGGEGGEVHYPDVKSHLLYCDFPIPDPVHPRRCPILIFECWGVNGTGCTPSYCPQHGKWWAL